VLTAIVAGERRRLDLSVLIDQETGGHAVLRGQKLEVVDDQRRVQLIVEIEDTPALGCVRRGGQDCREQDSNDRQPTRPH
jgi:hypothetical protein